jgi:hypothetical protein
MKINKMGIHGRRSIDGFLNTLFGKITRFEQKKPKLHSVVNLAEDVGLNNQAKKTLLEAELKKNQAFEFIRKIQNC